MTKSDIETMIKSSEGVLLYFSGKDCGVCHALRPKISELFQSRFPLIEQIYIDAQQYPDIAASFGVFSVPTIVVYLQGEEFAREGRNISLYKLKEQIERPYAIMTEGKG